MRIVAGSAKGRTLREFSGAKIRPTSDRVRESLFNILFSRIGRWEDKRVLDLCCGTGALAIEALSRGAATALLVDADSASCALARQNLEDCQLTGRASLKQGQLPGVLGQLGQQPFDVVFIDPPYKQELADLILRQLSNSCLVHAGSLICVETAAAEKLAESYGRFDCQLDRRYGSTRIRLFASEDTNEQ